MSAVLTPVEIVREAVLGKETIGFSYDGFVRVARPHIVGWAKDGSLRVRAWQVLSGKGGEAAWRDYRLSQMGEIKPTGVIFVPERPLPDPVKCGFTKVIAKII